MKRIHDVLERIRHGTLPSATPASNPFRLGSSLSKPAGDVEVAAAWTPSTLPADVLVLWGECRSARLFEDLDYGQWGLVLLDPRASALRTAAERASRPSEFAPEDVVLGEFLGDQELLVVAPSESGGRRILVALPLDGRTDWYGVGEDLGGFLDRYVEARGEKFWERR